ASGLIDRCIFPWIPLMHGGSESDTIKQWQELAAQEPDSALRSAFTKLVLVFAELTDSLQIWEHALEGWNMRVSEGAVHKNTDLVELSRWLKAAAADDSLQAVQAAVMLGPTKENSTARNG